MAVANQRGADMAVANQRGTDMAGRRLRIGNGMALFVDVVVAFMAVVGIGSIVGSTVASAQPRLDVRSLPAPSKQFVMGVADTVGVKVGPAGANVVWDFTQLRRTGVGVDSLTTEYLSPLATPPEAAALFPTAEVAVRTGERIEFFRTEGTMFRMLGTWTPTTSITSGTANPYDTRPVEITFGGQHVDQYQATLNSQTAPQVQQRAGTHTIVYDGFGRLLLPNGEVGNVARTKTTTRTTDTSRYTSPTQREVIRATDIESYTWLQPISNVPWVIVNFTTVRVTTNGRPVSTRSTREVLFRDTINSIPSSVDEASSLDRVYPNPTHAGDEVIVEGIEADVFSADAVDIHGVATSVSPVRIASEKVRVALHRLPAGSYVLVLRTPRGVHHRRIVVLP